jgi:hypothetical protein
MLRMCCRKHVGSVVAQQLFFLTRRIGRTIKREPTRPIQKHSLCALRKNDDGDIDSYVTGAQAYRNESDLANVDHDFVNERTTSMTLC